MGLTAKNLPDLQTCREPIGVVCRYGCSRREISSGFGGGKNNHGCRDSGREVESCPLPTADRGMSSTRDHHGPTFLACPRRFSNRPLPCLHHRGTPKTTAYQVP